LPNLTFYDRAFETVRFLSFGNFNALYRSGLKIERPADEWGKNFDSCFDPGHRLPMMAPISLRVLRVIGLIISGFLWHSGSCIDVFYHLYNF
jgi:hypothetical protein